MRRMDRATTVVLAAIGGLLLVTVVGLGSLAITGNLDLDPSHYGLLERRASPSPFASPSPTPTLIALQMPIQGDCTACHVTSSGVVTTKPIPALAHPVHGWEDCTACHATDSLVQTAPGHSGIHADQCLLCHTQSTEAAPDQPHPNQADTDCLSCHGSIAPLPASMATRSADACWVCHQPTTVQAPTFPHPIPSDGICLSCHSATAVGALPTDHAGRTDATCTVCHQESASTPPPVPHPLTGGYSQCAFCHPSTTTTAAP